MSPGGAMLILLPVLLSLLPGASLAATLGGLGGECDRGKTTRLLVVIRAEVIYYKKRISSFFCHFDRLYDRL